MSTLKGSPGDYANFGGGGRRDFGDIFEPDILLPAQVLRPRERPQTEGPKKLMLAVLEDAVDCFRKFAHIRDPRGRQIFNEAEEWVMSIDRSWPYSFENICEALNLNSEYLRRGLREWHEKNGRDEGGVIPLSDRRRVRDDVGVRTTVTGNVVGGDTS